MGGIQRTNTVEKGVPSFIARPAGHIITKWAYLEYQLSRIMWELLGLSAEEGRLVIADPRPTEKLEIIRSLLFIRKIGISDDKFQSLWDGISTVKKMRDLLAHGIWVKSEKGWSVLSLKGNVVDQEIPKLGRNRKIRPEGILVTAEGLASTLAATIALSGSVQSLHDTVPLPDKSPKQSGKGGRKSPRRKATKHQRQPKSNQE